MPTRVTKTEGPVFKLGDIMHIGLKSGSARAAGYPEGTTIDIMLSRVLRKGMVVAPVRGDVQMSQMLQRGDRVVLKGVAFKVENSGRTFAVLTGVDGRMQARH